MKSQTKHLLQSNRPLSLAYTDNSRATTFSNWSQNGDNTLGTKMSFNLVILNMSRKVEIEEIKESTKR